MLESHLLPTQPCQGTTALAIVGDARTSTAMSAVVASRGAAAWEAVVRLFALDLAQTPFFASGHFGGSGDPVWMVARAGGLGCEPQAWQQRSGRERASGCQW